MNIHTYKIHFSGFYTFASYPPNVKLNHTNVLNNVLIMKLFTTHELLHIFSVVIEYTIAIHIFL